MNNISVFGGTGFIGSRFIELNQGLAFAQPREENIPYQNCEILYLISTVHNYNIYKDLHIDIDTNLKKLVSVLEHCKNSNTTFNFCSSWFVYGDGRLPAKETDIPNPKGFYSITKLCAESLLISFCNTFNVKYRIFRLANIYGPNDKGASKQKNALTYLLRELTQDNPINLYHNGDFLRDYLYIDDACDCIKFLMENAPVNEIYNVGSGRPIRFGELIEFSQSLMNSTSEITSIMPPEFHNNVQIRDFWLDTSKVEKLGWKPKWNIWDGLKETIRSL